MKRQTIYDLIKSHYSNDERKFVSSAKKVSRELNNIGDRELASSISGLINKYETLSTSKVSSTQKVNYRTTNGIKSMYLGAEQKKFLSVITSGIENKLLNKIFIHGRPGTGKTIFVDEVAKQIGKNITHISMNNVLDSKLGQSISNIVKLFNEGNGQIIFIDEIDSIAMSRGGNDIVEISRVLNTVLKLIDAMNQDTILFVATNLRDSIDKAFIRRFDVTYKFDNYTHEDIMNIYDFIHDKQNINDKELENNIKKLINKTYSVWTPAYIKNVVKVAKLWTDAGQDPKAQILSVLSDSSSTKMVIDLMKDNKVPLRTIEYFTGISKDKVGKNG